MPKNIENDDIEIEIDAPGDDESDVKVVHAEEVEKPEVEETLESLKQRFEAQLEQERARLAEAERRANLASEEAFRARNESQENSYHLVSNAISTIQQKQEILKANYREAMAVGDYDRVADLQAEMATNSANLLRLEEGKSALESRPKEEPPRPYYADPVEAIASTLSPRSADWVRRNPIYARDQAKMQEMIGAHNIAVARGIPVDSDVYFRTVETILGVNAPAPAPVYAEDPTSQAAQVTQRRSAPPAAPVTRGGDGMGSRSSSSVTLTAAQREAAAASGMTEKEYAIAMRQLQKEGKLH